MTFLFSDIEGSTQLLQRLGDHDYRAVVEQHRAVLRRAFKAHAGHEVGTEGDSFFVTFQRAEDAVTAALEAQLALRTDGSDEAGVRVRMGLHTGQALVTDGDYYGLAVHQAARITSVVHGGQIVVSATTADLLNGRLPEGATFRDLGEHRLKDLERPHRLLQLCHARLPSKFPPPRSLDLVLHNLPIQTSTFVGRDQELRDVAEVLRSARLVTLSGPGGTGKTRLAYQAAAGIIEAFPGGVWVAELAPVADPGLLPLALLRALRLREDPAAEPLDTVVTFLGGRQALVILDNCEQVVDAAADLTIALLRRCPQLRIMATSREGLRVPGEVVYRVPGLGLPAPAPAAHGHASSSTDAVQLFVSRAAEVHRGFELGPENANDVTAICQRLDGLPLAIELAASRISALSPKQLHERLTRTLDLLSKGARGAGARQATMRGAIEWSHDLLDEAERLLFRRLSVFVGGWRLDAAEEVCAGDGLERYEVLDVLDGLVAKSLVAVGEDADGDRRYRLLETIRAYAAERLVDAGEASTVSARFSSWFSALVREADESPSGSAEEAGWFDRLEAEQANLPHRSRGRPVGWCGS